MIKRDFVNYVVRVGNKLEIMITARVARMYRFWRVCVCVCVCVSVRVRKTDHFITTSHFAFTWVHFGPIQACLSVHLSI